VKKTCARCGRAFTPERYRQTHCDAHDLRGRAHRSPTTRAQDAEYARVRAEVLAGDPPCHWCGAPDADTADHLIPVARGGSHARSNMVAACATCNSSRGANPDWQPA